MRERIAVAVHACGFKDPDEICFIAKCRLKEAASLAREIDIKDVIISGGVPYRLESKVLLADLMTGFLLNEFPKLGLRIRLATDCYNSSTDIQNILRIAKDQEITQLFAVSSYWHIWALSPLYRYWVRKMGINCSVVAQHRLIM